MATDIEKEDKQTATDRVVDVHGVVIKLCPFCGKPPEVGPLNPEKEGDGWTSVYCPNPRCLEVCIEVYSDDKNRKEKTIAKWNSRAL